MGRVMPEQDRVDVLDVRVAAAPARRALLVLGNAVRPSRPLAVRRGDTVRKVFADHST
jgi:hypothetical protein